MAGMELMKLKKQLKMKQKLPSDVYPEDLELKGAKCIYTGKPALHKVIFSKSY